VTGGAGFIGSNVVRALIDRGHDVVIIDDFSTGHRSLIDKRAEFIEGDFGDDDVLDRALPGCGTVMHLAASSIIQESFDDPLRYGRNNLLGPMVMLEAMRRHRVTQIVFSSSGSVYGEPERIPISEDDETDPIQLYGGTKLAFEVLLKAYHHAFDLDCVVFRYFNAYGPGDLMKPATRAVPSWIQHALLNEPVTLYWNGNQFRDYVYVGDVADAHAAAIGVRGHHVYNVGTGSGVYMKDVLATLESVLGSRLTVTKVATRAGDPMLSVADVSRILKELGWTAKTPLREGLRETVRFFDQNRELWRAAKRGTNPRTRAGS